MSSLEEPATHFPQALPVSREPYLLAPLRQTVTPSCWILTLFRLTHHGYQHLGLSPRRHPPPHSEEMGPRTSVLDIGCFRYGGPVPRIESCTQDMQMANKILMRAGFAPGRIRHVSITVFILNHPALQCPPPCRRRNRLWESMCRPYGTLRPDFSTGGSSPPLQCMP